MYGYKSFDKTLEKIDLKPVCKLKSKITFLKEVDEDISIGYGRKFITTRKSKIATVPIGYADGIRRCYKGDVVIAGKRCPIVGNICMDSLMVDVTDLDNVCVGLDVYIWDNDIITVDEVAFKSNQINYEVISTISDRVPRVFIL
jgi:alanine racemase